MSFVQQRERRSNAGNRMRALLDKEVDMEELFEDNESEDEEFQTKPEEEAEDVLDSDFDLNSSEGEQEQEDLGLQQDKQIAIEERQARRMVARNQQAIQTKTRTPAARKKERPVKKPQEKQVFLDSSLYSSTRQSSRTNTILNRLQVEEQLRENEIRKSLLPKRERPMTRRLTQEELLAEAAITEEENRKSLEQWQQMEAERKAKAKKKDKKQMLGPFVRYRSFTDGKPEERPKRRKMIMIACENDRNVLSEITDRAAIEWQAKYDLDQGDMEGRNLVSFMDYTEDEPDEIKTTGINDRDLDRFDLIPALESWVHKEPKPAKPFMCPITGLTARYRDPRTLVPYANKKAYEVIQTCLHHKMNWSSTLGIHLGNQRGAAGVPEGWDRMLSGKIKGQEDWALADGAIQYPKWLARKKESESTPTLATVPQPTTRRTRHRSAQKTPPPSSVEEKINA
ncbi:Vacuolar protein sorting-associated protein 72 [Apophysomyces sp. BC1034]|nr:Vacuolar protein sorting-associated protein 72 [Apophysomyces sp. BC1015]KAG0176687.1 Vacuolar protein sorting-associated protein 72 [Apophysomyces sp. BC1021]KAG0189441.1 Vacuolar protein sorting-associated protein 72 [Apophysomyces sp. BC1034]